MKFPTEYLQSNKELTFRLKKLNEVTTRISSDNVTNPHQRSLCCKISNTLSLLNVSCGSY